MRRPYPRLNTRLRICIRMSRGLNPPPLDRRSQPDLAKRRFNRGLNTRLRICMRMNRGFNPPFNLCLRPDSAERHFDRGFNQWSVRGSARPRENIRLGNICFAF